MPPPPEPPDSSDCSSRETRSLSSSTWRCRAATSGPDEAGRLGAGREGAGLGRDAAGLGRAAGAGPGRAAGLGRGAGAGLGRAAGAGRDGADCMGLGRPGRPRPGGGSMACMAAISASIAAMSSSSMSGWAPGQTGGLDFCVGGGGEEGQAWAPPESLPSNPDRPVREEPDEPEDAGGAAPGKDRAPPPKDEGFAAPEGLGEGRLALGRPVGVGDGLAVGEGLAVPGEGFPTEPIFTEGPVGVRDAGPGFVVPAGAMGSSCSGFSPPAGEPVGLTSREEAPGPDVETSSLAGARPPPVRPAGFAGTAPGFFTFAPGAAFPFEPADFPVSEAR